MPDSHSLDTILGGRVHLQQPISGNRAGHDAVLLASAIAARAGDRVADFGAGSGVAGICLAARIPGISLTLIDQDPAMVALSNTNLEGNEFANGAAIELDLTSSGTSREASGLLPHSHDHVIMNPPFYIEGTARKPKDNGRASAFVGSPTLLEAWMKAAASTLKPDGTVTIIHTVPALPDLFRAMDRRFGDIILLPVQPFSEAPANRLIVSGIAGSKAPLSLRPPLILQKEKGGEYTERARAILEEAAALALR